MENNLKKQSEKENLEQKDYQNDLEKVRKLIKKHTLPMRPIRMERSKDRLTVYFSAENRIDFRSLVKDLNIAFKTPIRLHQVGARDESKLIGGFGPCHKPLCCSGFLTEFTSISHSLVKKQGLENVSQYTGMCGKLMCCLNYEIESPKKISKKEAPKEEEAITKEKEKIDKIEEKKFVKKKMPPSKPKKRVVRKLKIKRSKRN